MLYLTVGTDKITDELFVSIKDKEDMYKPSGGLWLTKYDTNYSNYNVWVDYLIDNPNVMFYKNKSASIWHQPCSIVKLHDEANIFNLNNENNYNYLLNKYPLNNNSFSYESMTKDYDGIYVDLLSLITNSNKKEISDLVKQYCVSTLLLYNLDCIDYYHSGLLDIEPFDLEYYMYEGTSYNINYDKIKKKIKMK